MPERTASRPSPSKPPKVKPMKTPDSQRNHLRSLPLYCLLALAALALPATQVRAANVTWTGATGNWSGGSNWSTGAAPTPATMGNTGDLLFFSGAGGGTATDDLAESATFSGITFNSGAGAFTLSATGANSINLGPGLESSSQVITGGSIANNSSNTQTISAPLTFSGGNYAIATGASELALNGAITLDEPSVFQFNSGGGTINVSNSGLANANGILGGFAIISNTTWATINGSGNIVPYASASFTAVGQNGGISNGASNNVELTGNGGTGSTINSSVDINSLIWSPSSATTAETINMSSSGILMLGANGGIFNANSKGDQLNIGNTTSSGYITAGAGATNTSGTLSLIDTTSGWLEIVVPIKNNGSGVTTVNIADSGNSSIQLHAPSTYTGNTYINEGRVQADTTTSFGTGTVYVEPGGEAFLNSNGTVSNNFNIDGYGDINNSASGWGDPIALRIQTNTLSGNITLSGTSVIGTGNSSTIDNPITGPGGLIVVGSYGSGSMHLGMSSQNTYQGDTIIDSAAYGGITSAEQVTVWDSNSAHNNLLPYGASAGNLILIGGGLSQYAQLDLGGSIQNVNGLSSSGDGFTGIPADTNVTSNPSGGTLVVGNNNATSTFAGTIGSFNGSGTQGVSVTKVGTGTLTLSGTNNYTGTTDVENGVLVVTGSVATAGTVTLDDTTIPGSPVLAGNGNGTSSGVLGNVTLPTNNGANFATISPGTTGTSNSIGKLTMTSLTLNGGQLALALTNNTTPGATYDFINVTGSLTLPISTGAWTVTPSAGAAAGVYTVLTGGTSNIGANAALPTMNSPGASPLIRPTTYMPGFSGNSLQITVAGGAASIIWTGTNGGGGNGIWDVNTTQNWNDSSASTPTGTFYDGDAVTFNDTGINTNITIQSGTNLEANVEPSSITASANTTNYTIGGNPIVSPGGILKSGNATLTLTGSNSFAGTTNINAGILNIDNAGALGGVGSISFGGGTLQYGPVGLEDVSGQIASSSTTIQIDTNGQNVSFANGIASSNVGGLTKLGAGTLTLNGVNTYTGNTVVSSGSLVLTAANSGNGALASSNVIINSGATLVLTNQDTLGYTVGRNVVTINDGTLLDNTSTARDTLQNTLSMTGGTVAAVGTGNSGGSYSWDAQTGNNLLDATSDASGNPATITAQTAIQTSGTFDVTRGLDVTGLEPDLLVSGVIAEEGGGGNSLTIAGNGIADFTAANTYNKPTTISSGATLMLGNGGTTGSLNTGTGAVITDNGTLIFNRSNTVTEGTDFASGISGGGAVTQVGSGALVLSGNESYTGNTTVENGTLIVTGSLAEAGNVVLDDTTLPGNPVLAGNGNGTSNGVMGSVTLPANNGSNIATLTAGTTGTNNSIGELTMENLTMNGGQLLVDLNNSSSAGSTYDFINVLGALTLPTVSSDWTLTPNAGSDAGVYTVLSGASSNIGSGAALPTVNNPTGDPLVRPASYTPSFSGNSLLVTVGGGAASIIWTGTGANGNYWDIATTENWNDSAAVTPTGQFFDGDSVTFGDGPSNTNITVQSGTVSGDAYNSVTVGSMTVNSNTDNYTIGGQPIIDAGGLTKSGSSTLTLTGSNSFTGATSINGGILNVGNAGALAGGGNITFGGGTLQYSTSNQADFSSQIVNSSGSIAIDVNGQSVSYGSALGSSNTGGLSLTGNGSLTLNGVNTYTGNTTINSGTLTLTAASGSNGALASPAITVNAGAELQLTNNDTLGYTAGRNVVTLNDGTLYNGNSGDRDTIQNTVTMDGGTIAAAGVGNNNGAYSWDTPNANGNFLNATSDASGNPATISAQTALETSGTFNVTRGTDVSGFEPDLVVSAPIAEFSGNNSLTFAGNGITALAAQSTYNGPTYINSGATLMLGDGGTTGRLATGTDSFIVDDGTLVFDRTNSGVTEGTSFPKGISGSGAVELIGSLQNVTFNSVETYTGPTTITAGSLNLTGSLNGSSSVTVTDATLLGTGYIANPVTIGNGTDAAGTALLEPGNTGSVGTLTTGSTVSLLSDADFVFNLDSTNGGAGNGSSELLASAVSISGAEFTFDDIASSPGALTMGDVFNVISTTNGLTGSFSNLSNGQIFASQGNVYQAGYGADGLTLTVVPEPETWGMIILGFGLLLSIQKLRKRPMGI